MCPAMINAIDLSWLVISYYRERHIAGAVADIANS